MVPEPDGLAWKASLRGCDVVLERMTGRAELRPGEAWFEARVVTESSVLVAALSRSAPEAVRRLEAKVRRLAELAPTLLPESGACRT
jgi:hypothetical protein